MKPAINNILIIRHDRIGDVLMNLPMIHRLKENHPEAKITLLCQWAIKDLFMHCPAIDMLETMA